MLLWSGQSVSMVGSSASRIVFPLLVLQLTHSAAAAGFVSALSALPYALFGLPAGALIDRWDRKRVMLLCDGIRAINMLSVPVAIGAGHLSVVQIGVVAFVEGTLFTFYDVAQGAALVRVVTPEQLPAAITRGHAMVGISGILGPPIGGVLYGVRRSLPFLVDAISYTASVLSLLCIRTEFQGERTDRPAALHREILEGLRWIARRPPIWFSGLIMATNGMIFTGLGLILIVLARDHGASAGSIGVMFAIASIGGTAGSFSAGPAMRRFSFPQILLGLVWLNVLLWPLYLVITQPLMLGALTGVLWGLSGPFYTSATTYRRSLLPDELQGRVSSVFELGELGADVVGVAISGVLLQVTGVRPTLLILLGALVVQAVVASGSSRGTLTP